MDDLISRRAAIEALYKEIIKRRLLDDVNLGMLDEFDTEDILRKLPSAEPDNQVHLCDFCKYGYPECPAMKNDVIFGNGIGHDNVCACAKFEIKQKRKKGKWIWEEKIPFERCRCSECGYCRQLKFPEPDYFCPNCGADMRGEE